ncbi:hypothetical protein CEV32_4652 [Brucella rhizosphaerae]|uniref:Uncharacterized protein n=1 Tax=Brucella rhizosphaerae TaxID=571254 RepID=A0A256FKU1_9HYPH|nr:hypothetical protein CEV32_4652 [Brucella rhizosphaerae]
MTRRRNTLLRIQSELNRWNRRNCLFLRIILCENRFAPLPEML